MAYFAGNFIHGTAIKLQYRVFLSPWLKGNNGIICCAKGRDYSGSSPVNYIPRKSSKYVEDEAASVHVGYLGKRHAEPELNMTRADFSNKSSVNILDVDYRNHGAFLASNRNYGLNLEVEEENMGDFLAVNEEFIEEPGKVVEDSGERCHGIQLGPSRQDVEKSAIELLASRAFTAMELKKKLLGKRFLLETVDAVISDFQSRGLINDGLYAETYCRSRWSSSSWGPRRIKQALFKKGISDVDAEKAIELVFKNGESGEDQESGIAMSKLSIDQLYVQATKQWQRSHGATPELRKSRMIRWLQYRGFNWSVINYVLKKLESGNPY